MTNLYVASWAGGGGKTTLCVGIGRYLQSKGKKVGYLKPVALSTTGDSSGIDKDVQFAHQALELKESVEALCPLCLTPQEIEAGLKGKEFPSNLLQACSLAAADKDVVLLEGLDIDGELVQASCRMADILDAKVIMVVSYSTGLPWERITSSAGNFAQRLLGIVVNRVPKRDIESVGTKAASLFDEKGIKVLGILPEERLLLGVSVAELAEGLQAEVLCCPQASDELVQNLMIGALSVDSGVDYFARKDNKAVITRDERPDIQLAALATSTRCLILSGDKAPIPQVLHWAEDKGTPILLVKQDVPSIVNEIEGTLLQTRFRQQTKLERLGQILEQHFDFQTLCRDLGVAS